MDVGARASCVSVTVLSLEGDLLADSCMALKGSWQAPDPAVLHLARRVPCQSTSMIQNAEAIWEVGTKHLQETKHMAEPTALTHQKLADSKTVCLFCTEFQEVRVPGFLAHCSR